MAIGCFVPKPKSIDIYRHVTINCYLGTNRRYLLLGNITMPRYMEGRHLFSCADVVFRFFQFLIPLQG